MSMRKSLVFNSIVYINATTLPNICFLNIFFFNFSNFAQNIRQIKSGLFWISSIGSRICLISGQEGLQVMIRNISVLPKC